MDELLAAIGKLLGWGNRKEVTDLLHEKALPIAQHFINMGHGIETEASKETIRLANEARVKAEGDLTTANRTIDELKKGTPDLAAVEQRHTQALVDQKDKSDKREVELKDSLREVLLERDLGKIRSHLVEKLEVDPEVADVFTFQSQALKDRLKHSDHKSPPQVFSAGTKTPMTFAQGQEWFQAVAEEIKPKVPKGAFNVDVDRGSESSGHGSQSGGGGGGKDKKNIFDKIRSDTEAKTETQAGQNTADIRAKKIRGVAPAQR